MTSKKGIYILALVGLLLGIVLDFLITNQSITVFYYSFITLFCVLFALSYDEKNSVRLITTSFAFALFLSIPLLTLRVDLSLIYYPHLVSFLVGFPFFVYIVHAYNYAWHQENYWKVHYSSLFAAVWNSIVLVFIASIFTVLANLLIMLGAFIFNTVGSNYLWKLYLYNHHFKLIIHTTLFFIGLGIGQQNINIIYSLRYLMLRIMYYLFPFLALISSIYFILYLINYFWVGQNLFDPLIVLIPITSLGIIFFNAYFQDGSMETEDPVVLRLSLRIYRIILFFLILMLAARILSHYTLDNNLYIYLLIALLFGTVYAITALFSEKEEIKWIKIGNVSIAALFTILFFCVNLHFIPPNSVDAKKHSIIPSLPTNSQPPTSQ